MPSFGRSEVDIGLVIRLAQRIAAQFIGTTIQSITFDREENNNLFYNVLLTNGTTVVLTIPINADFENLYILASGSTTQDDNGNFRVQIGSNGRLLFQRRELGAWVTKGEFGDSLDTDKVFASGTLGGLVYRNSDSSVTLVSVGSDLGNRLEFGDENRHTYIIGNAITEVKRTGESTVDQQTNADDNITITAGNSMIIFNSVINSQGAITSLEVNTGGVARGRLVVRDVTDNLIIHEPITAGAFDLGEGFTVASGVQTVALLEPIRIISGHTYEATLYVADSDVTINGDNVPPFAPYLRYTITTVEFGENTTANNVVDQIEAKTGDDRIDASAIKNLPSGGSFNPADHSVTEFNDVTNAGSGAIITAVERVNIRTLEQLQDAVAAMLTGGAQTGITVTYDDTDGTIDFVVGGSPQAQHTNYLDITTDNQASSVDTGTALSSDDLNPTFTIPTFTGNRYLQILQSMAHSAFTSISIGGLNQIGAFTVNDNAVTISGQSYRQFVSTNLLTDAVSGDTVILGGAV